MPGKWNSHHRRAHDNRCFHQEVRHAPYGLRFATATFVILMATSAAYANDNYPSRPLRFLVPAPPATPPVLITRLHTEFKQALAHADVRLKLNSEASEIVATTPVEFRAFLRDDVRKWATVVRVAKIAVD